MVRQSPRDACNRGDFMGSMIESPSLSESSLLIPNSTDIVPALRRA